MTKMQSLAWRNGEYRQDVPLSQSPQAASQVSHGTMRSQQNETVNKSNQCMTIQTGAQLSQNALFTLHYGACSTRQPSNWQTTVVPHQAVSFQQTAGGNNYLQPSPTNLQSGNPTLQVTYGLEQNFHSNPAHNSSTQSQPNMTVANIAYPQQEISANWNQSVVSDRQHFCNPNSIFYNSNGESIKPVSPYTTTATSLQHREVAYNGTMGPAAAHQRPTAHDNNRRQNGTHRGFNLPCYNEAISQSFRNNSKTTNSSSGHNLHVSSTSQISQQYSTHNNGGEATSINSNSYNGQYETNLSLSKPNDSPSNHAADAQQEILKRRKSITRIADYLCMPSTTDSDGRMMKSNKNMQPVTSTVTEMYNSNASQSIPQRSRHSSPKATRSVILTSMLLQPLQSSVPNAYYVPAKGDANGNVSQAAFLPENNVGSLSGAPQLMQLLEGITPQINENQSSVENNCERHEMLSVKANDSSIHSSPGRTRAVAVVQPLLHESYQVASKQNSSNTTSQLSEGTATDESLSKPEQFFISPKIKHLKVGPYLHPENPNQMRSNKYAIRHSAASNDDTFMSLSSSARPQDLSQKQLCTVDAGFKLNIDMQVHQRVATTAQQSETVKAPLSQNGDKDKSEMPIDTKKVELSSVPTTPWTAVTLAKYIQDSEKAQSELKESTVCAVRKLLSMFWDSDPNNLKCALQTGMYNNLFKDVRQFCKEHVTLESVILSQVKSCFETQLKSYHVLKDKEVYSELPYKSSWLNVNEQLDDIDKDFDFPPSLKHHLNSLKSDSQLDTDDVETDDSISAQTAKEVSNKMFSSKELEQVDQSEEKQDFFVEATPTQTVSPNKMESADSSDPYSFEIQVFPPEDAKVIFEQAPSNLPESMDMDYQPEIVSDIYVEGELPKVINATLSNSKLEDKTFRPIEEACCIERLKETIWGSNTTSLSKCQCKIQQSHKDNTAKTCDKEVMAVQEKYAFRSDGKRHSATEREDQENGVVSVNNQVMAFIWPEIINVFSQTIDLCEDDDKPHSHSDKDPKNIDQISINSTQSSILLLSDDEDLSSSESETPNQMPDFESDSKQPQVKLTESGQSNGSDEKETNSISRNHTEIQSDPEVECITDQSKSTENMQSYTLVRSDKKTENLSSCESEVASQMTDVEENCTLVRSDKKIENLSSCESEVASQVTDVEDNCGQAQLTSTNVEESSLETEEQQTQISAPGTPQTTWSGKLKRPSSPGRFLPLSKKSKKCKSLVDVDSRPILEGASKCGKAFVHATDGEPPASDVRTVELVLFGSTAPDKCVLHGSRNNHISSPEAVSDAVQRPPKVLTVSLSPLKRKTIKTVLTWEYSVKRLYNKWKISLPPAKVRHRIKPKARKCTFGSSSEWSLEKADTIDPADTEDEEMPVSPKMRILSGKTKTCLNLRWTRSLSEELACDEEKTEKHTVMLKQPADQERNNAENGSEAVTPLQNNDALKFRVLPVSFNFGSDGRKETKDPGPEKPDLVEGKDNNHKKTVMARGTWYSNAEKKNRFFPPTTCSLFHTFQKKYMEKMQPYVDKEHDGWTFFGN